MMCVLLPFPEQPRLLGPGPRFWNRVGSCTESLTAVSHKPFRRGISLSAASTARLIIVCLFMLRAVYFPLQLCV